jgi:aldehyde dehydrogenase (NAD+)
MARIRVGSPLDKSTDMGALVSTGQLARVAGFVDRARAAGATVHQASAGALPATAATSRPRW